MSRKQARIAAMQLIYEQMEGGDGGEETLTGLIGFGRPAPQDEQPEALPADEAAAQEEPEEAAAQEETPDEDRAFIQRLVSGVAAVSGQLDGQIERYLRGWTLERVARVDLAILRLAIYELSEVKDTPASVVINEAVEMAKRYSTERSASFINGVLGAFTRESAGAPS